MRNRNARLLTVVLLLAGMGGLQMQAEEVCDPKGSTVPKFVPCTSHNAIADVKCRLVQTNTLAAAVPKYSCGQFSTQPFKLELVAGKNILLTTPYTGPFECGPGVPAGVFVPGIGTLCRTGMETIVGEDGVKITKMMQAPCADVALCTYTPPAAFTKGTGECSLGKETIKGAPKKVAVPCVTATPT